MTTKRTRQLLTFVMALVMTFSCFVTPAAASAYEKEGTQVEPVAQTADTTAKSSEGEVVAIQEEEPVEIMVRLNSTTEYLTSGDLQAAASQAPSLLQAQAKAEKKVEAALDTQIDVTANFALLFNGFSFTGEAWMVDEINQINGLTAFVSPTFELVDPETEVTPSMSTSTGMISATKAWDLGYTGEGTVVAVVDTGIRATHEAFSVMPENGKIDMDYLKAVYAAYGSLMHAGSDLDAIYENAKLPFNWDYFDGDAIPNHTASDHGTHVAGIAAGNNGVDFKGVAPDAQIVTMQVFTSSGGASFGTLVQALEDCVYLGVDSINMSLGLVAGWSDYASVGVSNLETIYDALEAAGVSVACAAGNDGNTQTWTNYGNFYYSTYQGLASNPDIGTVSAPATLPGSFGVASVVNSESAGYAVIGGENYYYGAASGAPVLGSIPGTYELVYVGLATPEEIEAAGGVEGKIALTQRGTLTFTDKCTNCAEAGAVGVLMFNNASGAFNPSISSTIPFGKLTLEEGQAILASLTDGVHGSVTIIDGFVGKSVSMATSSSWGTTSDLRIVPDIAAPGDGITSSVGFSEDNSYETWSGTSMATPHVAAGLNLIKERLREVFPDATAAEINDLAYSFAMSTAHEVNGFVRQQGAGVIDIAAALTTDVYLSVADNARPKLELDESENGTWTFTVTLNNIGKADHTYAVDVNALTHNVFEYAYSGEGWHIVQETTTVKLINASAKDVTDLCNVTAPETVTVPAGESKTIEVTIACSEELLTWFKENCASGMFLEGFVTFTETGAENPVDLSVPYLGYVGDWDYASNLDRGYYWQTATGELNYQQLSSSTDNQVGFGHDQGLGVNPYADMTGKTYLADRNAISPNGDGVLDLVNYIEFTLLRNPNNIKILVESTEGELLATLYNAKYAFHKDYYTGSYNGGDSFCYITFAFDMASYAENETVNLVFETWLDHEGYDPANNESGRWIIPVTKDTVAPSVNVTEDGIEIVDDNYVAYYAVYADEAKTELLYEEGVFATERGVASTYATEAETLYVTVADYAGNEQMYLVSNGTVAALDTEAFFHGRTVIGQQSKNYNTLEYDFEWLSFRTDVPAGVTMLTDNVGSNLPEIFYTDGIDIEYISTTVSTDGVLYANTLNGIYELDSETLQGTLVVAADGFSYRNISIRPGTDDMYAWCYGNINGAWGSWFCKVDMTTGAITPIFEFVDTYDHYWIWAMTFYDADHIAIYDHRVSNICISDLEGNITEQFAAPEMKDSWGASDMGIFGYAGQLLLDETTGALYLASDYSWFLHNHYGWCGIVRFDLDRETMTSDTTLMVTGEPAGRVVTGLFFADSIVPQEKVVLTDFALSEQTVTLESGSSVTIDVVKTPAEANWYDLTWSVDDESVATIKGNRKNVTVNAINPGTTTVTATATDKDTGAVIAVKTLEVTVTLNAALQTALNVEGGKLEFVSYAPYPFAATTDEATGRTYAVSTNVDIHNSESRLVLNEKLYEGDSVTFEYNVSSETDYDFLFFYVNGEIVTQAAGETGWVSYTYTAPATGDYTLEWVYVKDPAVSEGTDTAALDNICVTRGPAYVAPVIAEGYTGDLTWKLDEAGKLTFEVLREPGKMKKYTAKNEAPWAQYADQITSVEIPEGVTRISAFTFYGMTNLKSIVIPASVTEICAYAFKNSGLTSVTLNNGLVTIGDSAFYGTAITSVVIPETVETVGEYAFARTALTEATFTGNAPAIGTGAFNKVTATVYYPADNADWDGVVGENYGGTLTWTSK